MLYKKQLITDKIEGYQRNYITLFDCDCFEYANGVVDLKEVKLKNVFVIDENLKKIIKISNKEKQQLNLNKNDEFFKYQYGDLNEIFVSKEIEDFLINDFIESFTEKKIQEAMMHFHMTQMFKNMILDSLNQNKSNNSLKQD